MREVAPPPQPQRPNVSERVGEEAEENRNHIEHVRTDAGRFSGERTAKHDRAVERGEREIGQNHG